MKSKSYTNIIILFSICLLVSISTCSCSYISNGDKIYIDNKMRIIKSPFSSVKNVLIKNNKVLKENNVKDNKEFEILIDKKTNEQILIKTNEMELEDGPGGIWDGTPFIVRMDSKHEYHNINMEHRYNINANDRVEFVYNSYGVIASYELKKIDIAEELDRRFKEGIAYIKDIDTYEHHEYNYKKKYKKVYNLDKEIEIELEKVFDEIVIKNDNVIGIIIDEKLNKTYFKLNDEFEIINEISLSEYKKLIKDMTKVYDEIVFDNTLSYNENVKFRIVREDNYMYIVDDNDKILSQKYESDFISKMNNDCASINEIIFVRQEKNKYTFFNIEKDLFTTDVYFTFENPLNPYYVNPTTAKYLIGANDCYAIIDNDKVNIYNSISQNFITSVPFIKISENDERFYFSNFAVYGNFVCGKYVREDDFQFVYGKNKKGYYPYTNVDVSNPYLYKVINIEYDKHIKVLDGKCEVIQDRDTNKIYVIDNENLNNMRELPSIDAKLFGSFKCGDKTLYYISKDDYRDLYDEKFNLIEKNVYFINGNELIIYTKGDIENNYECIIINSDGELINKYYGFFVEGSALFLTSDDQRENVIVALHDANGKDIHKNIVYSISCKEGKEIPYFDLHHLNVTGCRISEKYFLFYDGNKSFIIDNNANVVKEFDAKLEFNDYNNIQAPLLDIMKDSDKMLYYFTYHKDGKAYNLLLDYKLNIVLDVESKYQNDVFKVNFYDDCFAYVKDLQFYVQDYNRNIIYKGDIGNFTSY